MRWNLGLLERPQWKLDENVLDPDHNSKRRDLTSPRPDASHP
jgi:hypothetical protein